MKNYIYIAGIIFVALALLIFVFVDFSEETVQLQPYSGNEVIENNYLRIEFGENGLLRKITEKQNDYTYSIQQEEPWHVSIYNTNLLDSYLNPSFVFNANSSTFSNCVILSSGVISENDFKRINFQWLCNFSRPGDTGLSNVTINTTYELKDSKDYVETWSSSTIESSKYSALYLSYPVGIKENPSVMEYGIASSYALEATKEPASSIIPFMSYSLYNIIGGQWDDNGNYIYFMTDDDGFGVKSNAYDSNGSVSTTSLVVTAENYYIPSNSIVAPYKLRIGAGKSEYTGEEGWISIADVYRTHLETIGLLTTPVEQRTDIPNFAKNLDLTFFAGFNSYPITPNDAQQIVNAYESAKNFYGAENANILYFGENGQQPRHSYNPYPTQVEFYTKLRTEGEILPCFYTLYGGASVMSPEYSNMVDEANFFSHNNQTPAISETFATGNVAQFDPFSEKYITWLTDKLKVYNNNNRGLGCIYSDGTHTAGGMHNGLWNPAMNSQRSYGLTRDVLRGGLHYYTRIQNEMKTVSPEFFTFHETFIPTSNSIGGPAIQSTGGVSFASSAHPGNLTPTLQGFYFAERVFGGYNIRKGAGLIGLNLLVPSILPFVYDKIADGSQFDVRDDYDLIASIGIIQGGGIPMVIEFSISNNAGLEAIPNYNGADPNYLTYNPGMRYIGSIAAESARFIKEAITLRREGRKYFFGQWQPTPNLDVQEDVHVFWNFGRTEKFTMSVPRIISSAWEANDGTLGFFFANHYRNEPSQTATLHIDFSRYGLESGTNYGLFRMGSNESLGRFSNDFTYTFTMPSKTMTGFYVTEVSTGGVGDNGGPGGPGGPGGTGFVPRPQCSDSRDNDSDGAIDYPADRGCSSSSDNSELDSVELNRTNYTIGDEINETIKEKTVEIKVVFWSITSIIVLAIMVIAFIAVKMIRKGRREQQLFSELQTSTNNI